MFKNTSNQFILFWSVGSLINIVIIVSQFFWFNRDQVLAAYPELTPYLKELCEHLDCQLVKQRDVHAIKLLNHNIVQHPKYEGFLLVNAKIKNELLVPQSFPVMQLALFDTAGKLLAYRDFAPHEYLDSSITIDAGMPTHTPVDFSLEVNNPTTTEVSFAIHFL